MNKGRPSRREDLIPRFRTSFLGLDRNYRDQGKAYKQRKRDGEAEKRSGPTPGVSTTRMFTKPAAELQEEYDREMRALSSHIDYEDLEPIILKLSPNEKKWGKKQGKRSDRIKKPRKPPEKLDSGPETWYKNGVGEEPPKPPEEDLKSTTSESDKLDFEAESCYKAGVGEDSPLPTTNEMEKVMSENTNTNANEQTQDKQEAKATEPGFGKRLWGSIWDNKGKIAAGAAVGVAVGVGGKVMMDRRAAKKQALREAAEQAAMSQAE